MEFFNNAKAVRFKSHHEKYLVADEDENSVRQHRNGSSREARWTVEFVQGNPHLIRLKSCYNGYLTASDETLHFGMTGKKVVVISNNFDSIKDPTSSIEWEPIKKEGYKVMLRTRGGKFLRANGTTPPFGNSITHDVPYRTSTQNWILWEVDVLDINSGSETTHDDDDFTESNNGSPSSSYGNIVDRASSIFSESRWSSIASDKSGYSSARQGGMELFEKAKTVRLQSHLGKYLVADDDESTVRQSRNGSSHKAHWTVEPIEGKPNKIRLKNHHNLYLTATDDAFLLGETGKKVLQTLPAKLTEDPSIEWEPIKEGFHLKLRTNGGKFLRANGGTPPWRNSVTHDIPNRTATQDWVLWGVDIVDILITAFSDTESVSSSCLSPGSSFSEVPGDYVGSPDTGSPMMAFSSRRNDGGATVKSIDSRNASGKQSPGGGGMEFFRNAKIVRLKSYHDKFLLADTDQESVIQDRHGKSKHARWTVELVDGSDIVFRLKSCYGKYLTATDEQFFLGVTGRKVVQSVPRRLDSSVEWEPVKEANRVRLKTRYGNYLRANGGLPPWRNSITHDIPHRHSDWILWEIETLEKRPEEAPPKQVVQRSESLEEADFSSSFHLVAPGGSSKPECRDIDAPPVRYEGRMIFYYVADEDGKVNDGVEGPCFNFKGQCLEELTLKLEEETGLDNIIVCTKNKFNGKICPMRLGLPPNNASMNIVVVPSTSKLAEEFLPSAKS